MYVVSVRKKLPQHKGTDFWEKLLKWYCIKCVGFVMKDKSLKPHSCNAQLGTLQFRCDCPYPHLPKEKRVK